MRRKKLFRTPYLFDAGGDISKPWWIELGYRDPKDGKMKRKRYQEDLSLLKTKKARYEHGEQLVKMYTAKLMKGWTPLDDVSNQVIYEDELEYHVAAQVYGRKRKANKNIRFYGSEFIAKAKAAKAKKTFESYRGKIREFISWLEREKLVDNDLDTFDNQTIVRFFDYLISERQLARRTVEKYKMTLSKFFGNLERQKIISNFPVHDIDLPETDEDFSAMPFLDDDMEKILPAMREQDPQLFLAALLQYFCFIRPGNELLNMKVKQINFGARSIRVPKNIAKKRKERVIDIPTQLFEVLQQHGIHTYGKEMFLIGPFGRPGNRQIGTNTLRNRFNKFRDDLDLSKSYKWYSFKHTGAGKLLESGATIVELMNQLGHTDITSTYRYIRQHFGERSEHVRESFPSPRGF
ncbi:site-specific integrase [uncultured Draconibacterium sp.]|uniref:tyrosine-type recombinase/integrase n=1 Tax=uncultured Draconibacterium sp. TaxID=1573823 RepID=UPI0029C6E057|nr:site-specific integrase [uncultured Draconibacterium sp.]